MDQSRPPATGLIIGKFLPPHAGHQYLVDYARQRVEHLTIILFTKRAEPIPGHLRAQWLRELYPDVALLHVADEYPVDFGDDGLWRLWIGSMRRVYPHGPDVVFSSEAYGQELARRLGARHELVDLHRVHMPISASMIRAYPLRYWEYIPPCVRAYYVRRVCLLGAECTGKTTLAQALAQHYQTNWVPEYARDYLLTKMAPCELSDFLPIARGQIAAEDAAARQANRVLFCDTNLLATAAWCERYYGFCPDDITRLASERTYHLTFVCDADIPWIGDGLRDSPHLRQQMQRWFVDALAARGLPYMVLTGSHTQRMQTAIAAVDALLSI